MSGTGGLMSDAKRHQYLMGGLLEAWDWFDNSLQKSLRASGFQALHKSQSMMIMYISTGVRRPIEIARKMHLSRQAIMHISKQLIEMNMVVARPDPKDGRSIILETSPKARETGLAAQQIIALLEDRLRQKIGNKKMDFLTSIINDDWGPTTELNVTSRASKPKRKSKRKG
jgi:DNA-binding MarR family transcriptional regulator